MSELRAFAEKSNAWPFAEARTILKNLGGKTPEKGYVLFETGYGPSGLPHIGTFGEVARTSWVRHAFHQLSDIPTRLWIAPPTKMDALILTEEGYYAILGKSGARMEMPGCSLCMGNQAQVREGATVVSTSTRNFPNRLGKNTNVFLASAELAAIASKLGHIPTVAEYHAAMGIINSDTASVYKYLNFDQIEEYVEGAKSTTPAC